LFSTEFTDNGAIVSKLSLHSSAVP